MRYKSSIVAGVLVGALSATAQANVVYEWNQTTPGPNVTATGGEFVVTDAAYRSGSLDFHYNDPGSSLPGGTSPGVDVDFDTGRITNSLVISAGLNFDSGYAGSSVRAGAPNVLATPGEIDFTDLSLGIDVTFNDDGTLIGSMFLYSNTGSTEVNLSGAREDWTAFNYGSDYFGSGRCGPPTCFGGAGHWQLASAPTEVPAPPVWPLFGLAALGLFSLIGLRRKV